MDKYDVLTVDDQVHCTDMLKNLLTQYPFIENIYSYSDPRDALAFLQTSAIDLVFLDIDMPHINGLKLAETIKQQFPDILLIFVTGHSDYALHGYELYPIDFLLKPVSPLRLEKALVQFRNQRSNRTVSQELNFDHTQEQATKKITVRDKSSIHFITINEINFVEKRGRKCIISVKDNKEIECSNTLNELEKMLSKHHFFRPHQSFLIPLSKVAEIKPDEYMHSYLIELENVNAEIRVSKNKYSELRNAINSHL
ncbi:LytTR family DNA-binding domain-containing protein [Priestia flexa]|uniref:LytR/AlgR family response regulator transcription factor n=1 Tax=Priestia flexa TaxID=86664 RepID=UPI00203F708F|nr:LytTR family DNA-binding domain-containing protein [Priestia flexa]MCM3067808.1 LytTR family DNA-binding domain-containing protein [Priestia flexa]